MDLKIRHRDRFDRANATGGAGSPQAWDEDHEIEGSLEIGDVDGLAAALADKASTSALATRAPKTSPHFETRIDLTAAGFTASFRDDGSGNLVWCVGAAGAADGAQVKVATVNKTTGGVTFESHLVARGYIETTGSGYQFFQAVGGGVTGQLAANSGGTVDVRAVSNHPLTFMTHNIERMRLDTVGNVGIGTYAPVVRLHVAGPGYTQIRAADDAASSNAYMGVGGATGYIGTGGAATALQLAVGSSSLELSAAYLISVQDNAKSLGLAAYRYTTVFATTGTINTSDATMKALRDGTLIGLNYKVSPFATAEIAAAKDIVKEIGVFKWQDAIAEKGEAARLHIGLTVQRAVQIMESHGLDPWAYGFMCRDEITRKAKVMRIETEQKTEPDPQTDLVVKIIDGVPTQVREPRPPKPVFEMKALVGEDGEIVMQTVIAEGESGFPVERQEPLLHPVPVMIEVEREVEIDEPAGERLGFRPDQLALFLLAGLVE